MNYSSAIRVCRALLLGVGMLFLLVGPVWLGAQEAHGVDVIGSVVDPHGSGVANAAVTVRNETNGRSVKTVTDQNGHFTLSLGVGRYEMEAVAPGFAVARKRVQAVGDHMEGVLLMMQVAAATDEVTVDANATHSIAATLASMDAVLDATSARTEITSTYIQNFTSPIADYGEIVSMAPGTLTLNGNGPGLGQSKTYFRGFNDGSYDIDFDGLPFFDTNSVSHHSWAFFPSQWIGGVDYDRSPGTASTIGPAPFGGSIHLLSREVSPVQNLRGGVSYGSFNTKLVDGQYDSGLFGPGKKLGVFVDVHHMSSDGYQTFNYQKRDAGSLKVQYKISDKTTLTGFAGVIQLNANTPGFNATRCQLFGAGTSYACAGALAAFAGSGINFYLTDNSDPVNYLDYGYNTYHVPTDFEYVQFKTALTHGITIDVKPYTYNYDNSEYFSNATPITEATTINGSKTYNGLTIAPCNVPVTKKGVTALPCEVDKYNSYRKYGETAQLSQVSRLGTLRTGIWYEWADTNRHQTPTDPLNNYQDQALGNFNESFWSNSYQPYAEYEFNVTKKLHVTPGVKLARYTIDTKQYADNGKTVGALPGNAAGFVTNHGAYTAWLPSLDANYRLKSNWSVYAQMATGSIAPPSNVFDFNQSGTATTVETLPKQQRSTTYQAGTVVKLKRVTLDADFYHIRFQNSYSSTPDPAAGGEPVYFLQPSSITKGIEAESNISLGRGLSIYLNGTVGKATYTGTLYAAGAAAGSPTLAEVAPANLWVAQTPANTESAGMTYQRKSWDFGFFNKRIGEYYIDNGGYHNQVTVNPFNIANTYFNYTVRNGSHFDQTKIKLSFNNLFGASNITGVTPTGAVVPASTIAANGTTYTDLFNTNGQTPIAGGDSVSLLAGRSVVLSITFGLSPKR